VALIARADDLVPRLGYPPPQLRRRDVEEQQQVIVRGAALLILLSPETCSCTKPPGKPLSEGSQVSVTGLGISGKLAGVGERHEERYRDPVLVDAGENLLQPTP
jgi:hypothetical protein